jgi:hypothetical protein
VRYRELCSYSDAEQMVLIVLASNLERMSRHGPRKNTLLFLGMIFARAL